MREQTKTIKNNRHSQAYTEYKSTGKGQPKQDVIESY